MDSLSISTGEKRISITRDGVSVGEIVFNPTDAIFAEKFYRLIGEFQIQLTEYKTRSKELDANTALDENGMPVNTGQRVELLKDACLFAREKINVLFGADISDIVFGDALNIYAIQKFLEGITPFIQTARVEKIQKYSNKKTKRAL